MSSDVVGDDGGWLHFCPKTDEDEDILSRFGKGDKKEEENLLRRKCATFILARFLAIASLFLNNHHSPPSHSPSSSFF